MGTTVPALLCSMCIIRPAEWVYVFYIHLYPYIHTIIYVYNSFSLESPSVYSLRYTFFLSLPLHVVVAICMCECSKEEEKNVEKVYNNYVWLRKCS